MLFSLDILFYRRHAVWRDYPLMVKTSAGTDWYYIYGPTGLLAVSVGSVSTWYYVHKDHLACPPCLLAGIDQACDKLVRATGVQVRV
jgi:hypothetical protein